MKPSIEEVKIIEKVKFWEEQEKINAVLVDRLLKLNNEIAILMDGMKLQDEESKMNASKIANLITEYKTLSMEISQQSNRIKNLEEIVNSLELTDNSGKGLKATHVSFVLSIIALAFSGIALL
ncbi:hypothetical protein [Planococcus maritimus]|uniref:hypothetical protein n=1 Tax=Planococcus maritimus TaxID=192421 RepID=UPI00079BD8A8|nr:hypothetical protein [Planococcus maritimus]KYG58472.1 hypothetical protein AY633_09380 [Planococcus maritimus]